MKNEEQKQPGAPYRRRKKNASLGTSPETSSVPTEVETEGERLSPGQMAQLIVDVRHGTVDREAASSLARPMGELAQAFAMQAEILKNLHDNQEELRAAVADDRRSEMMVNSSDALNETFRGVKRVQQQLVDRLDDRGRGRRIAMLSWVVAVVVVLAAVVLGTLWISDAFLAGQEKVSRNLSSIKAEVVDDYRGLLDDAVEDRDRSRDESRGYVATITGLRERVAALESEQAADREELDRLGEEAKDGSGEVEELRGLVASHRSEADDLRGKLEAVRAENRRLQDEIIEKIKTYGNRWADDDGRSTPIVGTTEGRVSGNSTEESVESAIVGGAEEATAGRTETAVPAAPPAPVADKAPTKREERPNDTAAAVARLNKLLAKVRFNRTFRLESVGKLGDDVLEDVVFSESIPGRGVVKEVSAKRVFFTVSGQGDLVELNFRDGEVRQGKRGGGLGSPVPFYRNRYRVTAYVLNGDDWLSLRDPFVRVE